MQNAECRNKQVSFLPATSELASAGADEKRPVSFLPGKALSFSAFLHSSFCLLHYQKAGPQGA
jgi:hypothetical protein